MRRLAFLLVSFSCGAAETRPPDEVGLAAVMPIAELARHRGCFACHHAEKRAVGPSFREIAARYHGQAGAEEKLARTLQDGSSGAWGSVPKPPNPALSGPDAAALARWVLGGGG